MSLAQGWITAILSFGGGGFISWLPVAFSALTARTHGEKVPYGPVSYYRYYRNMFVAMNQFDEKDLSPARVEKYARATEAHLLAAPERLGPVDLALWGDRPLLDDAVENPPWSCGLPVLVPYPATFYPQSNPRRTGLLRVLACRPDFPEVAEFYRTGVTPRLAAVLLIYSGLLSEADTQALTTGASPLSGGAALVLRELGSASGGLLEYEEITLLLNLPAALRDEVVSGMSDLLDQRHAALQELRLRAISAAMGVSE